jgi:hypothetical protein
MKKSLRFIISFYTDFMECRDTTWRNLNWGEGSFKKQKTICLREKIGWKILIRAKIYSTHNQKSVCAFSQFIPRIFINPLRVSPKLIYRILKILSAHLQKKFLASSQSSPCIFQIPFIHSQKINKQLFFG